VAEEQLGGRGRRGRSWEGARDASLLFSLCLRPEVATARLASFTPVAAEAVVEAIASVTGVEASVKPPNDVLLSGRKVAGLLAEASSGRVALGIGINVGQRNEDLPERPVYPATSLAIELGRPPNRVELLVEVLERLEQLYDRWLDEVGV
jgi:BirA family biotin operon repressor/biotin-[acetyl-CoA-carboxylase] ligase